MMMSTQVFPGLLSLIPLYLIYFKIQTVTGIHLVGSYEGLVITYLSFALPLSTWILVGIMRRIPRDLEEAGMIDGLSEIGAFFRILLPSMTGAVVAVAMFACITAWSELLFASILTNGSTQTLPIALSSVVAAPSGVIRWNELMAGAIYASLPIVIVFYMLQRQFVAGLSAGATKG
jgi:multiple sugar transport system permease protein